jgi:signal transduction histidine kinase
MRERAQFLNGTFTISKNKLSGTSIVVNIPLKQEVG